MKWRCVHIESGKMKIAIDSETLAITPQDPCPELVCLQWALENDEPEIVTHEHASDAIRACLYASSIIGHNIAYDMAVFVKHDPSLLRLVFDAYAQGKIKDTQIREALIRIEAGDFKDMRTGQRRPLSLDAICEERLGLKLDRASSEEGGWRTRYGELKDVPLERWPSRAIAYARDDPLATMRVYLDQGEEKQDETPQTRASFALRLMSIHGVVTDDEACNIFELNIRTKMLDKRQVLLDAGVVRKDGSRDTRLIRSLVEKAITPPPRTDASNRYPDGQIKTDEETLKDSNDPILLYLAEYAHQSKLLTTFVPVVRAGIDHPIHCSFETLVESGRTSCYKPNWQNIPREKGARECVKARRGKVLLSADYDVAELRALSQICYTWFGFSALRDAFIAGRDPHCMLASNIISKSYEDVVAGVRAGEKWAKDARQFAKIPNFGMAGGLGAGAFSAYAKGYDFIITVEEARKLKEQWLCTWPEMYNYFRLIGEVCGDFGDNILTQLGSNRIRGGLRFTQAANTMFQGLVADFAKDALWGITEACYILEHSPLYGARPIFFIHDEIILEVDECQLHDASIELIRIMEETEQRWVPDVPAKASVHAMRHWSKEAKTTYDKHNRLLPWD